MDANDRLAIMELTHAYCWALDTHQWDDLRHVFLPDARAVLGGSDLAGIDAIIARVTAALSPLDDSQHMVSTHQISITGDTATCRCYLQAQHVRHGAPGGPNFIIAGRYEDELVRNEHGWRISRRELIPMWREGNPAVVRP